MSTSFVFRRKIYAFSMKLILKGCFPVTLLLLLSINLSGQSAHFQSGISIRVGQMGHFYKMVTWDDSQYQEFAYWTQTPGGAVIEFMNFRVKFPPGYNVTSDKVYPMVVMLHGAGESGRKWTGNFQYELSDPRFDNNGHQLLWGGLPHRDAVNRATPHSRAFPGIVIFPQVSFNGAWDVNDRRMATLIIEYMISQYRVDPFRIYQHGLSNGAKATWEFGFERPDLIAAMLPMSGVGSDLEGMTDTLLTAPIWLFQGGLDVNPSPGAADQWIGKLVEKGGKPRYYLYPNLDHGTWNTAYGEPDFFSWMLDKNKRKIFVFGDPNPRSASISVPVTMGFSAGFLAYQWTRDGIIIPEATQRYYTATSEAVYRVKFQQRINSQWAESYPTNLTPVNHPDDLVFIPDTNFKTMLVSNGAINTNQDSEIQYSEAASFSGQITVGGHKIASLTGIEAFTAVKDLRVLNNLLTTLNLSENIALMQLHCQSNDLVSLDLSANINLTKLRCFDNELTTLNIKNGNNTNLSLFEATGNHLTCIQVDNVAYAQSNFTPYVDPIASFSTQCVAEEVVTIPNANFKNALLATPAINTNGDNQIQVSEAGATEVVSVVSKDISNLTGIGAFTALTHLYCGSNQLTDLDLSQNPNLVEVHAQNNLLTTILFDSLELLDVSLNRFTSLDISSTPVHTLMVNNNLLTFLNLKTGEVISSLNTLSNSGLSCILVDNVAYAEENFTATVDAGVEFSLDCASSSNAVYIPDVKLKTALLAMVAINTNGDGEIQFSEASAYTGVINVGSKGITNAIGLEAFTALTDLRVLGNKLTTLDVSKNKALTQLHCQQNLITGLDISENTKITKLRCFNNKLTTLNIKNGNNTKITLFEADINNLTCIQVDNVAYAVANFSAKIDPGVEFKTNCSSGEPVVTFADVNFKNALLADAVINSNSDGEIQVSEAEAAVIMDVVSKSITNLSGIEAFVSLTHLYCGSNQLATIDVRSNPNLTELHCQNNQLTTILFEASLNILEASFNQMTALNISTTPLNSLFIDNNDLTYLNLKTGTVLTDLLATDNPGLSCILVDDVAYAEATFSASVDPGTVFSTTCTVTGAVVFIPDAAFKTALLANAAINTNGDAEIQLTEASAYTGMINVGSKGINNVTGIEAFTALTDLRVLNNNLTALDLSANLVLIQLHCQQNKLTGLDISANTKITKLRCFTNLLTSLNIKNGNNTKLSLFDATGNDLTCVQVDNMAYAVTNFTSKVDPGVAFSTACEGARAAANLPSTPQQAFLAGKIYPNPFSDKVSVPLNGIHSKPFILVYDILGRVYEPGQVTVDENQATLDLSNLRNGLYILQVDKQKYSIVKE